jgi:hypothetical protein
MDIRTLLDESLRMIDESRPENQDPDRRRIEVFRKAKKDAAMRLKKERARQKMRDAQRQYADASRPSP